MRPFTSDTYEHLTTEGCYYMHGLTPVQNSCRMQLWTLNVTGLAKHLSTQEFEAGFNVNRVALSLIFLPSTGRCLPLEVNKHSTDPS